MDAIITQAEVEAISEARLVARGIIARCSDHAFDRTRTDSDGVYEAFSLGQLRAIVEALDSAAFDVMNHAHNGHGVPVTDDQMFARLPQPPADAVLVDEPNLPRGEGEEVLL